MAPRSGGHSLLAWSVCDLASVADLPRSDDDAAAWGHGALADHAAVIGIGIGPVAVVPIAPIRADTRAERPDLNADAARISVDLGARRPGQAKDRGSRQNEQELLHDILLSA